jgi:hypothetical protein
MKVTELSGPALDWAVAMALELDLSQDMPEIVTDCHGKIWLFLPLKFNDEFRHQWQPSSNWAQAGPFIERERMSIRLGTDGLFAAYVGTGEAGSELYWHKGPTQLIAAMRCLVAAKLSAEIEIPKELEPI